MLGHRIRRKLAVVAAGIVLFAPVADARVLTAQIAAVNGGVARAENVMLRLDWPDGAQEGRLTLTAKSLVAADFGQRFADIQWQCPLARDADGAWACRGPLRAGKARQRELGIAIASGGASAAFVDGRSHVTLETTAASPEALRFVIERVPVAWLKAWAATLWADGRLQKGTLDGALILRLPDAAPLELDGQLRLTGFDVDTPDGSLAAAGLGADLRVEYSQSDAGRGIGLRGTLRGGELLAGSFYTALPKQSGVALELRAEQAGKGDWRLPTLRWRDGGTLAANGSARIAPDFALKALDLTIDSDDLAKAGPRYLEGVLGGAGLAGLQLRGALSAGLALDAAGPQALELTLRKVDVVDPMQRFAFADLEGTTRWSAGAATQAGELRWASGALYELDLGAGRFALESSKGELRLAAPAALALLGGRLRLDRFALTPALGGRSTRAELGMTLEGLDIARLAKRFDWPAFTGTLDGHIPAARYADDRLDFEGALTMRLFGGQVRIDELAMERPFGVAPTLSGEVALDDLDLSSLTGVFGFGEITGRLDGRIAGLRLVDWSPVAFDADLHTDPAYKGRKRISQRAVQDISNVGGSGIVGGLQNAVLKMFDDFGYRRIGMKCRLTDNVCEMDGVGSAGQGYIMVEGSGLPRISVVGFQRRVDWPVLVQRLEAATEGQSPVIR